MLCDTAPDNRPFSLLGKLLAAVKKEALQCEGGVRKTPERRCVAIVSSPTERALSFEISTTEISDRSPVVDSEHLQQTEPQTPQCPSRTFTTSSLTSPPPQYSPALSSASASPVPTAPPPQHEQEMTQRLELNLVAQCRWHVAQQQRSQQQLDEARGIPYAVRGEGTNAANTSVNDKTDVVAGCEGSAAVQTLFSSDAAFVPFSNESFVASPLHRSGSGSSFPRHHHPSSSRASVSNFGELPHLSIIGNSGASSHAYFTSPTVHANADPHATAPPALYATARHSSLSSCCSSSTHHFFHTNGGRDGGVFMSSSSTPSHQHLPYRPRTSSNLDGYGYGYSSRRSLLTSSVSRDAATGPPTVPRHVDVARHSHCPSSRGEGTCTMNSSTVTSSSNPTSTPTTIGGSLLMRFNLSRREKAAKISLITNQPISTEVSTTTDLIISKVCVDCGGNGSSSATTLLLADGSAARTPPAAARRSNVANNYLDLHEAGQECAKDVLSTKSERGQYAAGVATIAKRLTLDGSPPVAGGCPTPSKQDRRFITTYTRKNISTLSSGGKKKKNKTSPQPEKNRRGTRSSETPGKISSPQKEVTTRSPQRNKYCDAPHPPAARNLWFEVFAME